MDADLDAEPDFEHALTERIAASSGKLGKQRWVRVDERRYGCGARVCAL